MLEAFQRFASAEERSSEPRTMLISGEAGIGKSRLVREACSYARRVGIKILQGNCFETDSSLPYAPLLDLLRAAYGDLTPSAPPSLGSGKQDKSVRSALSDLYYNFSEIQYLLDDPDGTEGEEEEHQDAYAPDSAKKRIFAALMRLLLQAAANQPLLVVIEDLHWSDEASLEFLLMLARRSLSANQMVLLLLTYRSDEAQPPLSRFLAALDRERRTVELKLSRLRLGDVDSMVQAIFNLDRPVRTDLLDTIYRLTEGNPFFVEEMLKALVEAGEIYYADGRWDRRAADRMRIPRSVQVVVQERLDGLSEQAQHVLSLAAVAGRRFDFDLLHHLTGGTEHTLLRLMKELIAAQLVVEESADTFSFRHALTREAVYSNLLARERRSLHRQVGEALEQMRPDMLEAYLGDLGYHFYQAEDWVKALDYGRRAGERALALYSPQAAVEHFTRALEAAERRGTTDSRVLHARGQANETRGNFDGACDDFARGIEAAHLEHDLRAEWQSTLSLGWLWTGRDYSRAGELLDRALELARKLYDPLALAQTLNRLGNWYAHQARPLAGRACHEEALALFREVGDRRGLAATLDLLGITCYMSCDVISGVGYYEQAVALMRELGNKHGLVEALSTMAARGGGYMVTLSVLRPVPLSDCLRDIDEALAAAKQVGWRAGEAMTYGYSALLLAVRGEMNRALEDGKHGLELAEEIEHQQWMISNAFAVSGAYLELLDFEEAQTRFEWALATAKVINSPFVISMASGFLALVHTAKGDYAESAQLLADVLGPDTPMETIGQRLAWFSLAHLKLARGSAEEALHIADRLMLTTPNLQEEGLRSIPYLAHLRGLALLALRRYNEAEVCLQESVEGAAALGFQPILWRCELALGQLFRALGKREEARECFEQARESANLLADHLTPDMRRRFLREADALIPVPGFTPRQATKREYGGLTAREREVALYIARGMINRAIAEKMVVGERTVEKHVENILSKLGFSTRAQIASWATERGMVRGAGEPHNPSSPEVRREH